MSQPAYQNRETDETSSPRRGGFATITTRYALEEPLMTNPVTEQVTDEEWVAAVVEQRRRVAFDAHPRIKAARRALKEAQVAARGIRDPSARQEMESEAWACFRLERDDVIVLLDKRAARGDFNP